MAKDKKLSALNRVIEQALGNNKVFGREDDPAKTALPNVWDWLTTTYVGGNMIKMPASITIQMVQEGVAIRITDRDLACAVEANCSHLSEALQALELVLSNPSVPIRTWGRKEPQLRKRKT